MIDFFPVGIDKFCYFILMNTPIEDWLSPRPRFAVILLLLLLTVSAVTAVVWYQVKKIFDNLLA